MIFGVDLGTRRVALACPEASWVFAASLEGARLKREYSHEAEAGAELGARAAMAVYEAFGYAGGHQFYWERPLVHPNARTAIGQGISFGALSTHLPGTLYEISNSQWKKALCGSGNADKDAIRGWLEEHQPALAALCGENQDLIDATCIGLYGADLAQARAL